MTRPTLSRRAFCAAAATLAGCASRRSGASSGVTVNDVHAQISETTVHAVNAPGTRQALARRFADGESTLCGGRYCSGGQWAHTGGTLLDTARFGRVLEVDVGAGTVTAEAGARWPAILDALEAEGTGWAVRQKQSGADEVSLGGTLSVNAHGRCLEAPPIVDDVMEIEVLTGDGRVLTCSRTENADRFARVIGGYGMFGAILTVKLKLVKDQLLRRRVRSVPVDDALLVLDAAAAGGALYGDFQYSVDDASDRFLREGLAVTYEPAEPGSVRREPAADGGRDAFAALAIAAHQNKSAAWAAYEGKMGESDGACDTVNGWQRAEYLPAYHRQVESATGSGRGSEVLSEIFVPRDTLATFLGRMRTILKTRGANLIYGNVRLIEPDMVTAMPWATTRMACIVFNLHADHDVGLAANEQAFRDLVDVSLKLGGTYYLAYHRWATPEQTRRAHPSLAALLAEADTARSDWARHYRRVL